LYCGNVGNRTAASKCGDHERNERRCCSSIDFLRSRNNCFAVAERTTSPSEYSESSRETNSICASMLDCKVRHFQQRFRWLCIARISPKFSSPSRYASICSSLRCSDCFSLRIVFPLFRFCLRRCFL
jgi:hypothetical protein